MGDDSFVEAQEDSEREELYRRVAVFRRKFETEVGWTVYSDSDGIRTLTKVFSPFKWKIEEFAFV